MQLDEMIVSQLEQARALQDGGFLSRFLQPASPSDVARSLGIAANLAHHHAKRYATLGLLVEAKREGGKVYYQLAAKVFRHRLSLLPIGDPDEQTAVTLGLLRERFLAAYEACDRIERGLDSSWQVYSFDRDRHPKAEPAHVPVDAGPARPAHFQVRTMSLSSERYRELVEEIAVLIEAAAADEELESQLCTLAFIAMDGALEDGSTDSQYVSSFLMNPLPKRVGDLGEKKAGLLRRRHEDSLTSATPPPSPHSCGGLGYCVVRFGWRGGSRPSRTSSTSVCCTACGGALRRRAARN